MFNIKYAEVCLSLLVLIHWSSFNVAQFARKQWQPFTPGSVPDAPVLCRLPLNTSDQWHNGWQFLWRNLNLLWFMETTDEAATKYHGVLRRTLKSRVGSKEQGGFCSFVISAEIIGDYKRAKGVGAKPPQKNTCRDFHVPRKLQIWQWKGTKCFLSRKC